MMGWLWAPVTYSFAPVPKLILDCIFFLNSSPSFPTHGRFPQNVIWKSTLWLKPTLLNPPSFLNSVINDPTPYLLLRNHAIQFHPLSCSVLTQPFWLLIKFQKLSLNRVLTNLIFFFFFWPHLVSCRILVSQSGIETRPLVVKAQSPNHGATRKFLHQSLF